MQIDNWFLDPETIKKSLSRSNNLKTRTSKSFACSIVSQKKILVKTKLGHLFVMQPNIILVAQRRKRGKPL